MDPILNNLNMNDARFASMKATAGKHLSQSKPASVLRQEYLNPPDAEHKKLKESAQQMEAMFVKSLLDAMEKTIDREDSLMGGGSSEGYFRDMMYENIANNITKTPGGSGVGLAESVYRQSSNQLAYEKQPKVAPTLKEVSPTDNFSIGNDNDLNPSISTED